MHIFLTFGRCNGTVKRSHAHCTEAESKLHEDLHITYHVRGGAPEASPLSRRQRPNSSRTHTSGLGHSKSILRRASSSRRFKEQQSCRELQVFRAATTSLLLIDHDKVVARQKDDRRAEGSRSNSRVASCKFFALPLRRSYSSTVLRWCRDKTTCEQAAIATILTCRSIPMPADMLAQAYAVQGAKCQRKCQVHEYTKENDFVVNTT